MTIYIIFFIFIIYSERKQVKIHKGEMYMGKYQKNPNTRF